MPRVALLLAIWVVTLPSLGYAQETDSAAVEQAVLEKMRKALSSLRRYLAESLRRVEEGELSPEREAELRALGYLGGD